MVDTAVYTLSQSIAVYNAVVNRHEKSYSLAHKQCVTLLGNFVEMSGQGENDPFIKNKRSERSMRGENQRPHQEGNGSRTASHAVHVVHTPPRDALFSLFSCPDKISQQSQVCTHARIVEGIYHGMLAEAMRVPSGDQATACT